MIQQIYELVDQRNADSPIFKQVLKSQDLESQEIALTGLGRIGDSNALPLVLPFLEHSNPKLRRGCSFSDRIDW